MIDKHVDYDFDEVFFRKQDVRVGVILRFVGRSAHNSLWTVKRIDTNAGKYGYKPVQKVTKLGDYVTLHCEELNWTRETTFGHLSYSAIWRLA